MFSGRVVDAVVAPGSPFNSVVANDEGTICPSAGSPFRYGSLRAASWPYEIETLFNVLLLDQIVTSSRR